MFDEVLLLYPWVNRPFSVPRSRQYLDQRGRMLYVECTFCFDLPETIIVSAV